MLNIECDLHMTSGEGEGSYANNSRRQTNVTNETKPVIEKATIEVYEALLPKTMVIADLGCSIGPNTMLFISNVINIIADHCNKLDEHDHVELQFFLNDLPGNDFNQLFRSLGKIKNSTTTDHKGDLPLSYYISGLPKSYYSRLFPRHSVHLFHSSYCLHWRSQVLEGLEASGKSPLNQDIYISSTTAPSVVKLFQEQFQKDFSLFLQLRHEELVNGGHMVLIFLGRKDEDVYNGDLNHIFGFVAKALESLVGKGLVSKEKLESFNLPIYGPSVDEVKEIVTKSHMFDLDHIKLFEANWDPNDDSEGDVVHDIANSSLNISKFIRTVLESLIASHFGGSILDALFQEFRSLVAQHLKREKTKFAVIVMSLKKI